MKEKIKKFWEKTKGIWAFVLACVISFGIIFGLYLFSRAKSEGPISASADSYDNSNDQFICIPKNFEFRVSNVDDVESYEHYLNDSAMACIVEIRAHSTQTQDFQRYNSLCYLSTVWSMFQPYFTVRGGFSDSATFLTTYDSYIPITDACAALLDQFCDYYFVTLYTFDDVVLGGNAMTSKPVYAPSYYDGYDEGYDAGCYDGYNGAREEFEELYSEVLDNGYEYGSDEIFDVVYDQGYEEGIDLGVDQGYMIGYDEGYAVGETIGYDDGYEYGYGDGYSSLTEDLYDEIEDDVLNDKETFLEGIFSIFDAPLRVIRDVFNFEVFGINISDLVLFGLTCVIVVFVIKKIKGD